MNLINNEQAFAHFRGLKNEVNKMRRRLRMIWASNLFNRADNDVWSTINQLLTKLKKAAQTNIENKDSR